MARFLNRHLSLVLALSADAKPDKRGEVFAANQDPDLEELASEIE